MPSLHLGVVDNWSGHKIRVRVNQLPHLELQGPLAQMLTGYLEHGQKSHSTLITEVDRPDTEQDACVKGLQVTQRQHQSGYLSHSPELCVLFPFHT